MNTRELLAVPLSLVVAAAVWSCQGNIGELGGRDGPSQPRDPAGTGGSGAGSSAPLSFECSDGLMPDAVSLRRLSIIQLENTVRDLLESVTPTEVEAIFNLAEPTLEAFPDDTRQGPEEHWGGFTRVDQSVAQQHVDRGYELAVLLGAELTRSPERLSGLAGSCASDGDPSNDAACMDAFVTSFGERVLRRGLSSSDIEFYKRPAGDAPHEQADWSDVTALLLASPEFHYFVENGADEVAGAPGLHEVTAYELASRLSYHFWQTLPDQELLALARSGELLDDATFQAQADRLFAHPRARETISQFYSEWFRRADVAALNSLTGTPAFDALRGDFDPSFELREAMFDEVTDMALYYSLDSPGHLEDFYRSKKSFARSQELADLYGVPVWDGTGVPPDFVEPERQGLITRAAMVASGTANTRPIMKGVFIRRALLCDKLPPPPANVMATTPEVSSTATSRQVVEGLTGVGACPSCHTASINPLGFATENFDSLGRSRDTELLLDLVSGEVHGQAPVDTAVPASMTLGDERPVADGIELQEKMIESGKLHACFARAYFRFTFGRVEDVTRDACALKTMHEPLASGRPLSETLRAVVDTRAFRQRNFNDVVETAEGGE